VSPPPVLPSQVSFHFSGILSPWIQRALIAGGFGTSDRPLNIPVDVATVVPQDPRNIHSVQRSPEQLRAEQRERDRERYRRNEENGLEIGLAPTQQISPATEKGEKSIEDERDVKYGIRGSEDDDSSLFEPLVTSKLPLFHFDLEGAGESAYLFVGSVSP
jgi:sodium-independent sulfate anion transporter 11